MDIPLNSLDFLEIVKNIRPYATIIIPSGIINCVISENILYIFLYCLLG